MSIDVRYISHQVEIKNIRRNYLNHILTQMVKIRNKIFIFRLSFETIQNLRKKDEKILILGVLCLLIMFWKCKYICDNAMITKMWKTSDTKYILNKKPPKMLWKLYDNTTISGTKVREVGRTVGSGRTAYFLF